MRELVVKRSARPKVHSHQSFVLGQFQSLITLCEIMNDISNNQPPAPEEQQQIKNEASGLNS